MSRLLGLLQASLFTLKATAEALMQRLRGVVLYADELAQACRPVTAATAILSNMTSLTLRSSVCQKTPVYLTSYTAEH